MHKTIWQQVKRVLVIFIGCLLLAVAYNMVFDPNGLVTGGVSGLGIVIKALTKQILPGGMPLWMSTLLLNVPIYLFGFLTRGRHFILDSVLGTVLLTIALYIVPSVNLVEGDRVLASIFGALSGGTGIALVLMNDASTGGTDMLGMSLKKLIHGHSVSTIIGVLDGLVVLSGAFVFGVPSTLYAVLSVFLMSRVSDLILTGQRDARMFYCISDRNEEIAEDIMKLADRGVSRISITGMYTGMERNMLMCVVSRRQNIAVKRIIRNRDPKAFVIISSVSDVRGEGFIEDILEG